MNNLLLVMLALIMFTITSVLLNEASLGIPKLFYSVAMFVPALILVMIGRSKNN